MANLIREHRVIDSNKRALIKYVIISDGTQESNTLILDASTLNFALNTSGKIMSNNVNPKSYYRHTIRHIFGQVATSNSAVIQLQWAGDANSQIVTMGFGTSDFEFFTLGDGITLPNPEANATGDILITTKRLAKDDAVTIILDIKKDNRDYDAGQTADPYAFNAVT